MGAERSRISQTFNAMVNSGNIVYTVGLTDTPASGGPGAFKKMLANATPTAAWWLCAVIFGNLSGAGATAFNYSYATKEDGTGTVVAAVRILLEAATAALQQHIPLRFPVKVASGVGMGANQTTASGKTLDTTIWYASSVGS